MPSFTGKTFSNFYKNLLGMNQTGNTGVDNLIRKVHDGDGNETSISLSDDNLAVIPVNDNSTATFSVFDNAGNTIFLVDTENSRCQVGLGQRAANTQYAHFGIGSGNAVWAAGDDDTHYAVPFNGMKQQALVSMGTATTSSFNDTNPASTLTISNTADDALACYWYIMDNITVDSVTWSAGADAVGGTDIAAHLMAYTLNTSGVSSGNLSSGFVVANGSTITSAGYEDIQFQTISPSTADVDAGSVCLFTFACDTAVDFTINANIKYHLR